MELFPVTSMWTRRRGGDSESVGGVLQAAHFSRARELHSVRLQCKGQAHHILCKNLVAKDLDGCATKTS